MNLRSLALDRSTKDERTQVRGSFNRAELELASGSSPLSCSLHSSVEGDANGAFLSTSTALASLTAAPRQRVRQSARVLQRSSAGKAVLVA